MSARCRGTSSNVSQTTTRVMSCPPERVLEALADGWTYATWVVGASRIRSVDEHWPAHGARIHHSVGVWPLLVDDATSVAEREPGHSITLQVRAWPTGEARVRLEVRSHPDGCEVRMSEQVVAGPARFLPDPLERGLLQWRNVETLRRLAFLAERSGAHLTN